MQIWKAFNKFRISKLVRHHTSLVFFNSQGFFTRWNQKAKSVAYFSSVSIFIIIKDFLRTIAVKTVICCIKSFNLKLWHWNAEASGFLFHKVSRYILFSEATAKRYSIKKSVLKPGVLEPAQTFFRVNFAKHLKIPRM